MRAGPRFTALAIVAMSSLCACSDPVGEGETMAGIDVRYEGQDSMTTYECSAFSLSAIGLFEDEDGSISESDFSSRVNWSSSNPAVVEVSNGDVETYPGSLNYYSPGAIVARSPGAAVIRAEFLDFVDTFTVGVSEIYQLRIEPALTNLAPESVQTFSLKAQLVEDTAEVDLSSAALWSLPDSSSPAALNSGSTVTAYKKPLNSPFPLEAELATCGRTIEHSLQIGAVATLELETEQADDLPVPLGVTDSLRVYARFEDATAPRQNLSAQLAIDQVLGDDSDASLLASSDSVYGNDMLLLTGLSDDDPVQYELTFEGTDDSILTREYVYSELELVSFRVDPVEAYLSYPDTLWLSVYGTFEDGYERTITRDVALSTLDEGIVAVDSGNNAGYITSVGDKGRGTIQASTTIDEERVTRYSDIEVDVP